MFIDTDPIRIDNTDGYIFAGTETGSYCFVPSTCIIKHPEGNTTFDAARYVTTAWHERNAAFNTHASGARLFPRDDGYLERWWDTPAAAYVERLQRTYSALEQTNGEDS